MKTKLLKIEDRTERIFFLKIEAQMKMNGNETPSGNTRLRCGGEGQDLYIGRRGTV